MIINEEDAVSGTGTSGWFSNVIWWDKLVSEIVNVFTSELCLYPSGALTSSTVYVPLSKSVNTYGSVVDVNCATVFPAESFTNRTAPANAFPVEASTFTILTTVFLGVFSTLILISLFVFVIVNLIGVLFNKYPTGALVSSTV